MCLSTTAGKAEYRRRREFCWDRDRGICILCSEFCDLESATLDHLGGRGMNGSKRDDRPEACAIAHWHGNNAKGSQSLELYLQKPLEERKRLCQPYLNL